MAGSITVSSITLDSDNNFSIKSNTGATLFFANTTGIDIANSIGATAITSDKILSIANTKITGNITSSQIAPDQTLNGNVSVTGTLAATGGIIYSGTGLASVAPVSISNGYVEWSIAANALTCSIKAYDGTDPSATNPVYARFRNPTLTTASYLIRTITSALSVVVSSGSTLGTVSGAASRIRGVLIDNAGTVVLGVYNSWNDTTKSLLGLDESAVYSTTAEGGAGAADSAQVIYTTSAQTSKAIVEVGYVESTQATAGTWATALANKVTVGGGYSRTGDMVQSPISIDGQYATGSTAIPLDNTIPQNTEGVQYLSQAITPLSAANILMIDSRQNFSANGGQFIGIALFQDATASAIAAASMMITSASETACATLQYVMKANTAASTTFKIRMGCNGAVAIYFNGYSAARLYGGVMASTLQIQEIFA